MWDARKVTAARIAKFLLQYNWY